MRHRALGDAQVGAIGLGDVSLARAAARGVDGIDRVVHDAIERGFDMIDAAEDAESLVGEAVRALRARDHVVVVTRVPALPERADRFDRRNLLSDRLPPLYIQSRVEASLRATRLEALPLAMLPLTAAWLESSAWPELAGTCARLVYEGNVLRWGATVGETDPVVEPWLSAIQVRFSACARDAVATIATALAAKLAVLAREPLAGGTLAGDLGPGKLFKPTDDRQDIDLDRIAAGIGKLASLVKITPPAAQSSAAAKKAFDTTPRPAHLECDTVAELALRYVIDRGAIAMPRMHHTDQLADAFLAASAPALSADLVERIESII